MSGWKPLRGRTLGPWRSLKNRRIFLENTARFLGVASDPDDWYRISRRETSRCGISNLLWYCFGGSLSMMLNNIFPEYQWYPWLFFHDRISPDFWRVEIHQHEYLDWLSHQLGIRQKSDWYHVKLSQVERIDGASGLLRLHGYSLIELLRSVYTDYNFLEWKFGTVSRCFWESRDRQRSCMDAIALELGHKELDDWYRVSKSVISRFSGVSTVLQYHSNSLSNTLSDLYPHHTWQSWRFVGGVSKRYWQSESHVNAYLRWLSEQLELKRMEDWLDVSRKQIATLNGSSLLERFGGLQSLLAKFFPTIPSISSKHSDVVNAFRRGSIASSFPYSKHSADSTSLSSTSLTSEYLPNLRKNLFPAIPIQSSLEEDPVMRNVYYQRRFSLVGKEQIYLFRTLEYYFANSGELLLNYKHPALCYTSTRQTMEFDIFLPSVDLVIEYQGQQHYQWNFRSGNPEAQRKRDAEKKVACECHGLTLIEVPYWWDQCDASLMHTIGEHRPDLYVNGNTGILRSETKDMDHERTSRIRKIWTRRTRSTLGGPLHALGIPANAPLRHITGAMVASLGLREMRPWMGQEDPTGWWLSEWKRCSLRVFWNGRKHLLLPETNGKRLPAPAIFLKAFPAFPLDGELCLPEWMGPSDIASLTSDENSSLWSLVQYRIVDFPHSDLPIEDRLEFLRKHLSSNHPILSLCEVWQCRDKMDLWRSLKEVVLRGAKGILLRRPGSYYHENLQSFYFSADWLKNTTWAETP